VRGALDFDVAVRHEGTELILHLLCPSRGAQTSEVGAPRRGPTGGRPDPTANTPVAHVILEHRARNPNGQILATPIATDTVT
jgi:hypothetical protein